MSGFALRNSHNVTPDRALRTQRDVRTALMFRPRFHLRRGGLGSGSLVGVEAATVRLGAFGAPASRDVARDGTMLRQACYLAAEHGAASPVLSVAVTEAQAACGMLACLIGDVLDECGLSPDRLELEFCEDSLRSDQSGLLQLFAALRDLGVRLVLAGFGGSISNLALLQRRGLAGLLSGLKLHPSLVHDLDMPGTDTSALGSLVVAAHALGLVLIAGHIDTALQIQRLEDAGCDEAAGAWLGPERGLSDTTSFLRRTLRITKARSIQAQRSHR